MSEVSNKSRVKEAADEGREAMKGRGHKGLLERERL